jgi:hypothetical protein
VRTLFELEAERFSRLVKPCEVYMGKPTKLFAVLQFCLAGLFGFSGPSAAENLNVKTLAKSCQSQNMTLRSMCETYFLAVMDSFEAAASLYGAKIPFCYPKGGLSPDDMILAFRLWASTNPEEEERAAISGIIISMVERFPCQD